ncbi:hypothetical protein AERO_02660 [Aeromicrobium fastidiosum]|uniref:hypothetical protein n=1 Tax=Aeromicrobium fastidiosum TaxID=52699 RepID=UPI0020236119|nr:hypothetical protein [Aeromicrobium fastidiosum]MCL8250272.1 hypothetical protein [Aeromicrobium fastidiosum]
MTSILAPTLRTIVPADVTTVQRVRLVAGVMVVAHLVLRAWALLPAWFYSDDLRFIEDGTSNPLTAGFLMTPHDSQLMPVGVLVSWVVAHAGPYAWGTAALLTLILQAVAVGCCWLMLRTAFGERWAILVPFGLFLFSAMGIEGMVWWAAALNALPMQIGFMLTVTAVLLWSRERRARWAWLAAAAFALTVASGPRGLVTVVPLGLLMMLFLTSGPWWRRPVDTLRRHALLVVPLALLGAGYLALYATTTTSPVAASTDAPLLRLAGNLVGRAWLPSVVGGPWQWELVADPVSVPDPSDTVAVVAAIVVVAAVVVLLRRNPGPTAAAAAIMVAQLTATYVALVFGRALQLGALAGLNMRYLADALPVTVLVIGLMTMPLLDDVAPAFRRPLPSPRALAGPARAGLSVALGVALIGGVVSTIGYARPWHDSFPARAYVANAVASLRADPTPVADLEVPDLVQLSIHYPSNLPSRLLAPYGDVVQTTDAGNDIRVLDSSGTSRQAVVEGGAEVEPADEPGCGLRVTTRPASVTFDFTTMSVDPWTAISYAGSAAGRVSITADGRALPDLDVAAGPHTYFLRTDGAYSRLTLRARTPDVQMCVDRVRAGEIKALP